MKTIRWAIEHFSEAWTAKIICILIAPALFMLIVVAYIAVEFKRKNNGSDKQTK